MVLKIIFIVVLGLVVLALFSSIILGGRYEKEINRQLDDELIRRSKNE